MKLSVKVLIIGAGYSGLIENFRLKTQKDIQNVVIIDKGYKHPKDGDYIVFLKGKMPFTKGEIAIETQNISSGKLPFTAEYSEKLYAKGLELEFWHKGVDKEKIESIGYTINSEFLLKYANIYRNIEAVKIDINKKILYGKILHLNEDVEIHYEYLVNTMPIHRFAKLLQIDLLKQFGLFISYFPIGIKRERLFQKRNNMLIKCYSDYNIPFYRTQEYGDTIYYEYCINKPFQEKFDNYIIPGKFTKPDDSILSVFYDFLETSNIYNLGRFALWHPDFLLDHAYHSNSCKDEFLKKTLKAREAQII